MNKKFQQLVDRATDAETKQLLLTAVPEIYQKQFIRFLHGKKKIKPFFMKWLGKTPKAREALESVIRDDAQGFLLEEALSDGKADSK